MDSNLLSPKSIYDPRRQRSLSNVDTIVSSINKEAGSAGGLTAVPSFVDDISSALTPDPGTEADFRGDNNPFAFSPGQLNKLLNPKSLPALQALGGLQGLTRGLCTDLDAGLSIDETSVSPITFDEAVHTSKEVSVPRKNEAAGSSSSPSSEAHIDRVRVFKRNVLPAKKPNPIWKLMWIAFNETVLILLTVAGVISLALGLYETFNGVGNDGSAKIDWVEGVAILVAVLIVVIVGSHNDWQKEKAFVKLNTKKDDREIKVLRSGKSMLINVKETLVGDVLFLEPGEVVPVDGIFIDGHDVKCDESSATGESDALKKTGGARVSQLLQSGHQEAKDLDPFIISGSKVLEGMGTYLCTSVGVYSSHGKIMMSVRTDIESTPLQKKLEKLAVAIAWLGGGASAIMFFILLFRFVGDLPGDARQPAEKASTFVDLLVVAIAIIAVAVPEGLPLAVTLALAFATTMLLKENNLVRVLRACETMGNATTICSDKTGTLTTNKMTVVSGLFGPTIFSREETGEHQSVTKWASGIPVEQRELIKQSIAINSTAFEGEENGQPAFVGSKTETAMLQLAKDHLGLQSLHEFRANPQTILVVPFDSARKYMAVVIRLPSGGARLLVKGASEIVVDFCTNQVDTQSSNLVAINKERIKATIEQFARRSLRTIGLVYQDFEQWPPAGSVVQDDGHVDMESVLGDLNFLGLVGIQDPVRPGVPEAVKKTQGAGVTVRMVTGDNIMTAQAVATECGIFTDGVIMEGPVFRRLPQKDMDEMLPRLQVLARSSPEDKRILVTRLKALGETVAVTGDGTNDAPALKAADVGFSMGVSGTEVAKEASSIVLMDDNFTSIVTALKWGRAVNDSVQKFLQFQITVNIVAVILSFVTAMYDDEMEPVLKAVQLLWVNLIMDTFAALALATDPPTEKILDRPPQGKSSPLITINMWKMIIGQAILQLIVMLTLYFAGPELFSYDRHNEDEMVQLDTIVFNTFVWMQIFNELNNRRLDNKFNVFEGIHRNKFFIFINLVMVGLQVCIIFIGSDVFDIKPGGLDGKQWGISVAIAVISLPWGILVRIFPDAWFETIAITVGKPFVFVYTLVGGAFKRLFRAVFRRKPKDVGTGLA